MHKFFLNEYSGKVFTNDQIVILEKAFVIYAV